MVRDIPMKDAPCFEGMFEVMCCVVSSGIVLVEVA